MGHGGLIKLDKNYFKEHIDELIEEYLYSIPHLTIDDSLRKQIELDRVNKEKSELEQEKKQLPNLIEEAVEKMKKEFLSEGWVTPKVYAKKS